MSDLRILVWDLAVEDIGLGFKDLGLKDLGPKVHRLRLKI